MKVDELHPKSAYFSPLPIVGTWVDWLVGRCLPSNHLPRNIDEGYISNALHQVIFS